jgi:cytochrome c oxidase subunit II
MRIGPASPAGRAPGRRGDGAPPGGSPRAPTTPRWPRRGVPLLPVVVLALGGCTHRAPSTLTPGGYGARRVAGLWWLMFWISVAVFGVVVLVLLWGLVRRRRTVRHTEGTRLVAVTGAALPFLVLASVYGVGLDTLAKLATPRHRELTVAVTGHRWWWEVRYPGTPAVTANEIHVPVGRTVVVRLTTADVNHSFWVPELTVKTDLVAGRTNATWLRAEKPGRYRGQCAEYCGLQHAAMAFLVVAESERDFDAWLRRAVSPARPSSAAEQNGMQVFQRLACASCHAVRGTTAHGRFGPDLSTVGSRWSIGAGAAPNDTGHLGGWIANSQTIKPGNKMPPQPVPARDLQDLLAYLRSLKAP